MAEPITSKFLFRSDWTLAADGGARVKLHEIRLRQKLRFKAAKLNYWRTKDKAEVDFVIEAGQRFIIDQIDLLQLAQSQPDLLRIELIVVTNETSVLRKSCRHLFRLITF